MTDSPSIIRPFAPPQPTHPIAGVDPGLAASQRSFQGVLGRARTALDQTPEARARESAEQLVAVAFVQPLLKELRDTNRAAPPWQPTQGEKMFAGLADAELSQRLVHASRFPLVERITRDLLARSASAVDATTQPGGTHAKQA